MREALHARGLKTFIDWNDLTAGLPWPNKLESALQEARAVVVFVGASGLGPWQTREMYYALELQVAREKNDGSAFPVIPVVLDGSEPPTGFLALNTWVDLRGGVSDASLAQLLRAIGGERIERPPLYICPYRDLRAFREEDAALFFGRDETIRKLVQRVDASSRTIGESALVAVVGPSGSGKSSVVMAGVLPALRRQRPPAVVWDYVSFAPGETPWRRFANELEPLLDPGLSEAAWQKEAATLADALRGQDGIGSTIRRILQKSRGTDRLLVVVDQFEELFTQTDETVAREFVRALLAASRSSPMTLMFTLRSDYYGRVIALDRDLSNALPPAQVNLGPIRREELRDVIKKPADLVGLSFEAGLVDRIVDDAGDEPGKLPLLEYALTELWKARSGDRLTFHAYDRIGHVSGALANRADALLVELNESQQAAVRRLMERLIRVVTADEESADTRRRARRSEIDDEAWALVPLFTSPRTRLLVAAGDTVEVAHEALISEWGRLREWLDEDRPFLVWRQQLGVYHAAWVKGGRDEETLLRGPLLAEAQKWLRTRSKELSPEEREYIEAGAQSMARSRSGNIEAGAKSIERSRPVWTAVAAILVLAMIAGTAYVAYLRSGRGTVRQIIAKNPESFLYGRDVPRSGLATPENIAALFVLGRQNEIRAALAHFELDSRLLWTCEAAVAARLAGLEDVARSMFSEATALARASQPGENLPVVASRYIQAGWGRDARALLREAEAAGAAGTESSWMAEQWANAGDLPHAREIVNDALVRLSMSRDNLLEIAGCAIFLAKHGEPQRARMLAAELWKRYPTANEQGIYVKALADVGAELGESVFPDDAAEGVRGVAAVALARKGHLLEAERIVAGLSKLPPGYVRARVAGLLALKKWDEAVVEAQGFGEWQMLVVNAYIDANRLDEASRFAARIKEGGAAFYTLAAYAKLSAAFARAGRRGDAADAYGHAAESLSPDTPELTRDRMRKLLVESLAARGRYYDARKLADSIEDDEEQWAAYLLILGEYTRQDRLRHRNVLPKDVAAITLPPLLIANGPHAGRARPSRRR